MAKSHHKKYKLINKMSGDTKAIYLIKPRGFAPDIVYKVLIRGSDICFCRIGGQFYYIRNSEAEYNENMSDTVFSHDKKNFSHSVSEVMSLKIRKRRSLWTGKIPNNGIVTILLGTKKEKYIIHSIQTAAAVNDFFSSIPGLVIEFDARGEDKSDIYRSAAYKKDPEYKKVSQITKYLNILGGIFAFWFFLYPKPYNFLLFANVALPVAGLIVYLKFEKYLPFTDKGNNNPNLIFSVLVPVCIIVLRALRDCNIFYTWLLWALILVFTLLIFTLILFKTNKYKKDKWLLLAVPLIAFYAYGSVVLINCSFDYSKPVRYPTVVLDKNISSGKTRTYEITVEPWGPFASSEADISKQLYSELDKGDKVFMYLKNGSLGIPWFIPGKY